MNNKKKILIYGIGSLQNRGCEALVDSTIKQIGEEYSIVGATFDYEHDKDMYKDRIKKFINHHKHDEELFNEREKKVLNHIKSIPFDYYNYESLYERDVIKELKQSDIALHLGGDNYCYGVNEWIFTMTRQAKENNKKVVLWGASLFDEILNKELIEDLDRYDLLMLRESISYNAVKRYIDEEKLMLIPDPAFSLPMKEIKLDKWYKKGNILGINLSPLTIKTEEQYNSVKEFINYLLSKTKYNIALLPHVTLDEASDLKVLGRLAEDYQNEKRVFLQEGEYNCEELKYIISHCDLLVTARTHASIAAYSTCVPTLVIGYSVKSRGIAQDIFGSYKDYVLPAPEITKDTLIEKFEYIDSHKKEIKKYLEEKMKVMRKDASQLFEKMNKKLKELDENHVCDTKKCTGCGACLNSCPKDAITMVENKEGFLVPKIDLKKCIHCDKCRRVCPARNKTEEKYERDNLKCYAAKTKDLDVIKKSSSGGIFYYLAKQVLQDKGIVYGAELVDSNVNHIRITTEKDIYRIQGSKYAQSNMLDIYPQIKKDLKAGKKVLFSGTPCQLLAVKAYLGEEYKNLILVSVICHGVMNSKLLAKRIKEVENKFNIKVNNVLYRSKRNGWDIASIEYQSEKFDKAYPFNDDGMMGLYLKNLILRHSCYDCPGKGLDNNPADIVLGDYWGVYYEHKNLFDKLGTSAIMIKTKKGEKLFNAIKKNFIIEDTTYKQITKYNTAFVKSVDKPTERATIFNELESNSTELLNTLNDTTKVNSEELEKTVDSLKYELNEIKSSKRYKIINKIANVKNRLLRK